jgi:hypothetical protein
MTLPDYWLKRPEFDLEPYRNEFESALGEALKTGVGQGPKCPLWAWLGWLCETKGLVAHGTGQENITVFEPRQSNDLGWFGNRKAVYAASDALWAMFFAIMNRPTVPMRIVNSAVSIWVNGTLEPRYFFGASADALKSGAFRSGWVYFLPDAGFEREPADTSLGVPFQSHHLACLDAVRPSFRVQVQPDDFPFLGQIHAYEEETHAERVARDPDGFPWLDDPASTVTG